MPYLVFSIIVLLFKAVAFYRERRAAPPRDKAAAIQPVPPRVSIALIILFMTSCVLFNHSVDSFIPSIFEETNSTLRDSTEHIFSRLERHRPDGLLPSDEALRSKFVSNEARLLYLKYGPDTMTDCFFCSYEQLISYFLYSLPEIIFPHILNLCVLGLATSRFFIGKVANAWRTTFTWLAAILAVYDILILYAVDHMSNKRAKTIEQIDFVYSSMKSNRSFLLAVLDGFLALLLFLSSTNRVFAIPPTPAVKVETTMKIMEKARGTLNRVALIRNAVVRDKELRGKVEDYWSEEEDITTDVMKTREVVDGVRNALETRIDLNAVEREAEAFVDAALGGKENRLG
ncbi:hypothetical protein NHQ30_007994 [Ciborinia camelliae]|nr:hypothetical protein NHQ30_007994 [Ciborinia camelliae]